MRTKLAIVMTLVVAGLAVGAARAQQPAPPPAPAPAGSGSAAAAAPTPTAAPAAGSAAAPAAAPAAGSAAPAAAPAAGSAAAPADAPAAGSAAAPAAGSAAPAPAAAASTDTPIMKPAWVGSPLFCYDGKPHKWFEHLACQPWDTSGTFWMPKGANAAADGTDTMFYATMGLSIFCFFAITIVTIYFVIRYRHRPGHKAEPSAAHNDTMELTWTIIPTIIVVFLFVFGWRDYVNVVTPPVKAVEINVLAQKWNWTFTHQNGVSDNVLYVPVNTPIRLVMTSKDVIHSFYAPVMRTKQDVVPRRYTFAWFYPTKTGTYRLYCAEYCGGQDVPDGQPELNSGHSQMKTILVVLAQGDYQRYLADSADTSSMKPEELGAKLYEKKGCIGCHSIDGSAKVGPTWKGDYGQKDVALADGSKITVDDNYIRESIMSPQAKARPGFPPSMPSFEGQLKENEIQAIIAYIKSLK
jgi:cytochrome c oxidase subunit II